MDKLLAKLLERLATVAVDHPEIRDSEVRESLGDALYHFFLCSTPDYTLPDSFAMYTPEGDRRVREVLIWFLPLVYAAGLVENLDTFHKRLAVFQNSEVSTLPEQWHVDDYFGWQWIDPNLLDENGLWIAKDEVTP